MQGNNFQIDKEPLLALPICAPAAVEQQRIGQLVERVIECRHQLAKARSSAEEEQLSRLMTQWDEEIQESVELLYKLSQEERASLLEDGPNTVADNRKQARLL